MQIETNRNDVPALVVAIGLACLLCPVTVSVIRNPSRMWLYAVLCPCAVLSVSLCTRRWGRRCDSLGVRPPTSARWHWIGLALGLLMPFALRPLWQTVGLPAFVPPVDILPVISAAPAWEETIFRGVLLWVLVVVLAGDGGAAGSHVIWRRTLAVVLSASAFAAGHMISFPGRVIRSSLGAVYFLDFFFSGLLFGIVRLRSKSLLPGMVMHATTNLVEWILMFQV